MEFVSLKNLFKKYYNFKGTLGKCHCRRIFHRKISSHIRVFLNFCFATPFARTPCVWHRGGLINVRGINIVICCSRKHSGITKKFFRSVYLINLLAKILFLLAYLYTPAVYAYSNFFDVFLRIHLK